MSRVRRIYAEKRPGYDVAARQLCQELREALGTDAIARVRLFQRYDVEGLSDAAFESARGIIFSEPNADVLYDENLPQMDAHLLAVEYLPGQYDQRADSAAQCLQLLSPDQARPKVVCAKVYAIEGEGVTREMMDAIAHHVINPVEARRASMEKPETLEMQADAPADVAIVEGFTRMDDKVLSDMVARMGMAMSAEDLCFCRDYFCDTEKRDPSVTELRAIEQEPETRAVNDEFPFFITDRILAGREDFLRAARIGRDAYPLADGRHTRNPEFHTRKYPEHTMLRKKLNPHTEVIRMPRRRILKIVEQRIQLQFRIRSALVVADSQMIGPDSFHCNNSPRLQYLNYLATMFTTRFGTQITFTTFLPSSCF